MSFSVMVPVLIGLVDCLSACCLEPIKFMKSLCILNLFALYRKCCFYRLWICRLELSGVRYSGPFRRVRRSGLWTILTCHVISDTSIFFFICLCTSSPYQYEMSAGDLRSTCWALRYVLRVGVNVPLQHSCYPSEAFQRQWLRHYLQRRRELLLESASAPDDRSGDNDTRGSLTALDVGPFDEQLERLLRHVQHFSVVRLSLICAFVSLMNDDFWLL